MYFLFLQRGVSVILIQIQLHLHSFTLQCIHASMKHCCFGHPTRLEDCFPNRNREDLGAKEANCLGQKGSELPRAAAFGQSGSIQIHSNRPISSSNSPVIRHCPSCPHLFIHSFILCFASDSPFSILLFHSFIVPAQAQYLPLSVNIMQMRSPLISPQISHSQNCFCLYLASLSQL